MKYQSILFLIVITFLVGVTSCKKDTKINKRPQQSTVVYATGFDIIDYPNYRKLIIKSQHKETSYLFIKPFKKFADLGFGKVFYHPIKRIVVTSTTHIPMLELLDEEQSLIGFPNTKYISSSKTRALINTGQIKELGNAQSINTELLLDLQPEVVIGFSEGTNQKMYANIKKSGIPVLINNDWLEQTPLGRAEWIKFFGILYGKEQQADSIFKRIEKHYLDAKKIALKASKKPKTLSGAMYMDMWNLPAGESYGAQLLKDANVDYPWHDSKGSGSLSLSFESVFETAQDADVWLFPSLFGSYKQLQESNLHYAQFKAFKNKKIYNFVHEKGETGGILYYELAPIQPDIVLKDIIKVTHPELLLDYKPVYLKAIP